MALTFYVPGPAVGKGRPRIGRAGKHARMFTPEKTANYESLVALAASQVMKVSALIEGPCEVWVWIDCQIPASWSAKKREQAVIGSVRPTTKPDLDNVVKAIFDAINGIVWKDDVQVVSVTASKRYWSTGPGVRVTVEEVA